MGTDAATAMMQEKTKQTRMILIAGGVILATILGFVLWRKFKKLFQRVGEQVEEKDVVKAAEKAVVTSEITKDKTWFESAADRLYRAMEGLGTTEKSIYDVFRQLNTKSDYYQLVATFGVRTGKSGLKRFTGNLSSWLEHELTAGEIAKCNEILNKIGVSI
jgi:hypothetical protein